MLSRPEKLSPRKVQVQASGGGRRERERESGGRGVRTRVPPSRRAPPAAAAAPDKRIHRAMIARHL